MDLKWEESVSATRAGAVTIVLYHLQKVQGCEYVGTFHVVIIVYPA
jgi:hypothetical protein